MNLRGVGVDGPEIVLYANIDGDAPVDGFAQHGSDFVDDRFQVDGFA